MRVSELISILDGELIFGEDFLDREVASACGSDLMSDVLAFVKLQSVLLTGLINPQTVRTAEMMDMGCIVFVRGKNPDEATIQLAKDRSIALVRTGHTMFTACGLLYQSGLRGGA